MGVEQLFDRCTACLQFSDQGFDGGGVGGCDEGGVAVIVGAVVILPHAIPLLQGQDALSSRRQDCNPRVCVVAFGIRCRTNERRPLTIAGGATGQARIHPSRLTVFVGNDLPDRDITASAFGWGDSVLVSVMQAVKQAESASANINSLIYEANVDVVSIEGLSEILKLPGGEDKVRSLLQMNLDAKSNLRALVLDAKNTYQRKAVSFGSLPDLMDRFDQHAAGAADIPMTRFMGMSPGGMNSTGESDLRNYYDRVSAGQTLEMSPAMMRLDEALIRSATGARKPAIHYEWNPLWQLGEKDKADIFKAKSDAARTLAGTGGTSEPLMPIEALSDALVNEFIEDGSLAGLEAAIEEYGKLSEQDDEDGDNEAAALG